MRARAHWIDEGEKNTSYFLRLKNKHQSHNVINKLSMGGNNLNETLEILYALSSYYEKLYTSDHISLYDIDQYIENTELTNYLSDEDKEICDKIPTIDKMCGSCIQHEIK